MPTCWPRDIDEETAIKYIDRFLMYYIMTADRLTRTAVWLDKLEGGIDHLQDVIVEDKLGICQELEESLQFLVDTYTCEWAEVVKDPEKRQWFRQFVNTDETESCIEIVHERGQQRPGDWPSETVSLEQLKRLEEQMRPAAERAQAAPTYVGARRAGAGLSLQRWSNDQVRQGADCRVPFHQPWYLVCLSADVPAQESVCLVPGHSWRHERRPQNRLPTAQKDFLAGLRRRASAVRITRYRSSR